MPSFVENGKNSSDKGFVKSAVLIELSKAFDCIQHDLLVAKVHGYGISLNATIIVYSNHKRRMINVEFQNVFSSFKTLLEVPEGSVLGPICLIYISMIYCLF